MRLPSAVIEIRARIAVSGRASTRLRRGGFLMADHTVHSGNLGMCSPH